MRAEFIIPYSKFITQINLKRFYQLIKQLKNATSHTHTQQNHFYWISFWKIIRDSQYKLDLKAVQDLNKEKVSDQLLIKIGVNLIIL